MLITMHVYTIKKAKAEGNLIMNNKLIIIS